MTGRRWAVSLFHSYRKSGIFQKPLGCSIFIPTFIMTKHCPKMNYPGLRTTLSSLLFVCLANTLTAQKGFYTNHFAQEKDSITIELAQHPQQDTGRVQILSKILHLAIFLSQRKQALPYWQEALLLSRKLKYKPGEAYCLRWKGSYYKSAQKNDSAFIYLDSAIALTGNLPDSRMQEIKGFSLFEKGMMYEFDERFYTALSTYFESLKTYDGSDLRKQKMISLRVAEIYKKLQNNDKALEYLQNALKYYEDSKGSASFSEDESIYAEIAEIYYNHGDLPKATAYLDKLRSSMPDTVETIVTGTYYYLAGEIALKENRLDSAYPLLKESLKYFGTTQQMHADDIARVNAGLATIDIKKTNLIEAKKYVDKSMTAAKLSNHKETMAGALTLMAAFNNKTGNNAAAYKELKEASILNDSVLAETNVKQAATLSAIYENGKKEEAISQLETDKRIQSAEVKQESLFNTILIITIVALLAISIITYLYYKNKRKIGQQRIAELQKEQQLLRIEAMIKGQEEERSRLAKDLHDGLGGMLSGVKISFSNIKENLIMDGIDSKAFEKSIRQLDLIIEELRKVAHNLMPDALAKFGLKSAVKDYCESMQISSGSTIICEQFGPERNLGSMTDINVYRIVQELINNAIRHGNAEQVVVQLTKAAERVLITVEDNGKGFEIDSAGKIHGIGLNNIRSRVNYLNGKLDIESKSGEGTTVNIELIV